MMLVNPGGPLKSFKAASCYCCCFSAYVHLVMCMHLISHVHCHRTPMLPPGLKQFAGVQNDAGLCLVKLRLGLDTTRVWA